MRLFGANTGQGSPEHPPQQEQEPQREWFPPGQQGDEQFQAALEAWQQAGGQAAGAGMVAGDAGARPQVREALDFFGE